MSFSGNFGILPTTNLLKFKIVATKTKYDLKQVKVCGSSGPKQVMEKDPGDFNSVARGHDFDGITEVFHTKNFRRWPFLQFAVLP